MIEDLGATPVTLTAPNRPTTAKVVDREFKRDLDAYLAPYGKTTAGIVAFNDAHPADTLKFGQARLRAAAAINLADPATRAGLRGRPGHRPHGGLARLARRPADATSTRSSRCPRARSRSASAPATRRWPCRWAMTRRSAARVALSFTGKRGRRREAARLRLRLRARGADPPHAVGGQPADVALRRARGLPEAHVRPGRAARRTSPTASRCPRRSAAPCPPRSRSPSALRRPSAPSRPASTREYTASTTANVISTALDATLTVSDPGRLMNGTFALPEPLQVTLGQDHLDGARCPTTR